MSRFSGIFSFGSFSKCRIVELVLVAVSIVVSVVLIAEVPPARGYAIIAIVVAVVYGLRLWRLLPGDQRRVTREAHLLADAMLCGRLQPPPLEQSAEGPAGARPRCTAPEAVPHGTPRLVGQSAVHPMLQPMAQSMGPAMYQSMSHPMGQSMSHPMAQSMGPAMYQSMSHPMGQSMSHPMAQSMSHPMGQSMSHPMAQSMSHPMAQSMSHPMGQSMSHPMGQSMSHPMAQSMSHPMGQSMSHPMAQSMSHPMAQSMSHPMAQSMSHPMGQSMSHPMGQSMSHPMAQSMSHPMGQSMAQVVCEPAQHPMPQPTTHSIQASMMHSQRQSVLATGYLVSSMPAAQLRAASPPMNLPAMSTVMQGQMVMPPALAVHSGSPGNKLPQGPFHYEAKRHFG